jgi:hypothetical protein
MRGKSSVTATADGVQRPQGHISLSLPTRYLSAAPHLRGGMLTARTTGQGRIGPKRRPIGRGYALNVLFGAEGVVPMSAVDIAEVRKQCRIALLQTTVRDILTAAAVIASAVLEPLGTVIVFGLAIAIIIIIGRVRVFSGWTVAAIIAVAVVLFAGVYRRQESLAIPLACLAACFIIFIADNLLSLYQLRKVWRISSSRQERESPNSATTTGTGTTEVRQQAEPSSRAYHDDYRFIGTGTPLKPLRFFVLLNKRRDADKEILEFRTSQLLRYIGLHLLSLGVSNGQPYGKAHGPLWIEDDRLSCQAAVHFTDGFPYLSVMPVAAVCVPESRKHPVFRVKTLRLDYHDKRDAEDILAAADRSQPQDDERYWMRASTSSLDGQVVITIYIHVSLRGHSLAIVMWPHILAPVVSDLRVADKLAAENSFVLPFKAATMTARQFGIAARRIHTLGIRPRKSDETDERALGLRSTRERYAYERPDNMNRALDSDDTIQAMIMKITSVTDDYLTECNIDTKDYNNQYTSITHAYTVMGDTAIYSGNFKDSTVTTNINHDEGGSPNTSNNSRLSSNRGAMMAVGKKSGSEHKYNITGPTAIYSGEFEKTKIKTTISTPVTDPLADLSEVLNEIRQSLEEDTNPKVPPDVRDKASQAAIQLKHDLPRLRKKDPDTRQTLRARVKALIDLLAPVAEIIAGTAALQAILQHL